MPLDGFALHLLKTELEDALVGDRVDKVYQPSREEILLNTRGKNGVHKVYISSRVQSPRIHLTKKAYENPSSPPMLCMLLRKYLIGAKIEEIMQCGTERILGIRFSSHNELGDAIILSLYVEIMGRNSNVLLVGNDGKILDATRRVDFETSPTRPILPGVLYERPPLLEGHLDLLSYPASEFISRMKKLDGPIADRLLSCTAGLSPLNCRELVYQITQDSDTVFMSGEQWKQLENSLSSLPQNANVCPYVLYKDGDVPFDFSFLDVKQYGKPVTCRPMESFSALLDAYYSEKDEKERLRQQSRDLWKTIQAAKERLRKKIAKQELEIQNAQNREEKRIFGDLLTANISNIPKGSSFADVINYYDPECSKLRIPLDVSKTVPQNAQRYYKEYRKAQVAEQVLAEQISMGQEEMVYLDTVMDALSRVSSTKDISELRDELISVGYLRGRQTSRKSVSALPPRHFVSSDGFDIYVGRNNRQNDLLTLKTAHGRDIWLHTKNIPGSHTIIETRNRDVPDRTLEEAAVLAAYHSKAFDSAQVPVDYTLVKHVHKPNGAKPGKVIYDSQQTIYVKPEKAVCDKLMVE